MDRDIFDALFANKKTETRNILFQPLLKLRKVSDSYENTISNTTMAQNISAVKGAAEEGPSKTHIRSPSQGLLADITTAEKQIEVNQGIECHPNEGSIGVVGKAHNRGSTETDPGLLQTTFHDSKEDWRSMSRTRLEKTLFKRRIPGFKN
ncbi:hypothetical protein AYI68_g2917 [Smittium mucronatum]|uniref:Uncharacterized protein n=1 Tax=Smittium mucronatum TaxID=133383 RepID=A0A1R0H1E5_9FUNG|nr:hypothetical protein AYI68_g2917 [Smittium mucronatum]